jgi:predicted RNA-binding Zn ribbon-like protein
MAPSLIAGATYERAAMEFLNSAAGGEEGDILADKATLLRWLADAGLAGKDEVAAMLSPGSPRTAAEELARVGAMRDWFREIVQAHRERQCSGDILEAVSRLNTILAEVQTFNALIADVNDTQVQFSLQRVCPDEHSRTPLACVAKMLAQFLCGPGLSQVKLCAGRDCGRYFLDSAKAKRRKWCDMSSCGNKAKQDKFRQQRQVSSVA